MKVSLFLVSFLLISLSFTSPVSSGQCTVPSSVYAAGCLNGVCVWADLIALINTACNFIEGEADILINPSSSYTINIQAASSLTGLTLGTNVVLNVNDGLSLSGNLAISDGSSSINVAEGIVVNVGGSLTVASSAVINIAGNVTAQSSTINGIVYLKGNNVQTSSQTAWLVSTNTVSLSGSSTSAAQLRGNGGIDGSVSCSGNVTIAAGNSPGTVFIHGDYSMSDTTTLEVDVDSSSSFDRLIISGKFSRNGILYANFEGYTPDYGTNFVFATHSSSQGSFNIAHGDYDATFNKVHPSYGQSSTSFEYNSASIATFSFSLFIICVLSLL